MVGDQIPITDQDHFFGGVSESVSAHEISNLSAGRNALCGCGTGTRTMSVFVYTRLIFKIKKYGSTLKL